MIRKIISILLNIKGDFQNLFIFNEYNELTGKSRSGIVTLTVILGITFLALGYAIGGINYLKEKMDDPFTNWVNLEIKPSYRQKVPRIQQDLEIDSLKSKFLLNNIGEYNIEYCPFVNKNTGEEFNRKLRTIDLNDNLLTEILHADKGNVVSGYSYSGAGELDVDKCGVIVKESTLIALGYENIKGVKKIPIKIENYIIYPEIISVVKELPNLVDVVVSSHFYRLIFSPFDQTNFLNTSTTNRLELLVNTDSKDEVEQSIKTALKDYGVQSIDKDTLVTEIDFVQDIITVYFGDYYKPEKIDTIFKVLTENSTIPFSRFTRWECNVGSEFGIDDPYYLSFNFNKLDKVRDFKNYMDTKYQVEISMDQVEQKENFALVSKLTSFISFILFGFSILSIVFYVNSLLRTHLEKIKMNLGTLKAFGLNNNFLISSYLKIIFTFISISIIIAFVLCGIWDLIEEQIFNNSYFDVFNYKILLAIIIIILTALITSQRTISKTLLKTPGDLIYNR